MSDGEEGNFLWVWFFCFNFKFYFFWIFIYFIFILFRFISFIVLFFMKVDDILGRVRGLDGIAEVNEMQRAMAGDCSGRVMLTAPTGSGKTLAFVVRLLREVEPGGGGSEGAVGGVQGVVVAPTRELVVQIGGTLRGVLNGGGGPCGVRAVTLYGGHDFRTEVNELAAGADVVVATPGRLLDHINRGSVDVSGVRCLVVDEFDKCLEMGFQDEMSRIVRRMRGVRTLALTSATAGLELPGFVGDVGSFRRYDYGEGETSPAGETRVREVVSPCRDKLATLSGLLRCEARGRVIVFVNHRESAERVFEFLMREGVPAVLYHGGLDQQQRRVAVELLANGSRRVMVATDLAARGLDIAGLDGVVHYHLPGDLETWTHRNGRTGRQGARGEVYAIVSDGERLPEGAVASERIDVSGAGGRPVAAAWETLYINAGRKEKVSKGDVAGYVMQRGGLGRDEVGRIMVDDHYALVAVPAGRGAEVAAALAPHRLKKVRVRVRVM